jgi:LmbE family N-acetylglucosaminyl deacetylase
LAGVSELIAEKAAVVAREHGRLLAGELGGGKEGGWSSAGSRATGPNRDGEVARGARPHENRGVRDPLDAARGPGPRASRACNPLLRLGPGDVVVVLLAHPDDESFFTGGTLALLCDAGVTTVLVTATLGELGRPNDPALRGELEGEATMAAVRRDELRRACEVLGIAHHLLLGGAGRWTDSGHPARGGGRDRLVANVDAAAGDLLALLVALRPQVLVSFDARGCTGHPDHLACHRMAMAAATALSRAGSDLHGVALIADGDGGARARGGPAAGPVLALDVTGLRARKVQAVSCHRSQVGGAARDLTALDEFDPASAITRYLPGIVRHWPGPHLERYTWLPAARLAAAKGGA